MERLLRSFGITLLIIVGFGLWGWALVTWTALTLAATGFCFIWAVIYGVND